MPTGRQSILHTVCISKVLRSTTKYMYSSTALKETTMTLLYVRLGGAENIKHESEVSRMPASHPKFKRGCVAQRKWSDAEQNIQEDQLCIQRYLQYISTRVLNDEIPREWWREGNHIKFRCCSRVAEIWGVQMKVEGGKVRAGDSCYRAKSKTGDRRQGASEQWMERKGGWGRGFRRQYIKMKIVGLENNKNCDINEIS